MHLCTSVSEEGGDGEGTVSEAPSLLAYTLRYVSLAELGTLPGWLARSDAPAYRRERGGWGRGGCGFRSVISDVIHT